MKIYTMIVLFAVLCFTYASGSGDTNTGIFRCTNCLFNNCSIQTGECLEGCIAGSYGNNCNLSCSENGTCFSSCNRTTGECDCSSDCEFCFKNICFQCHDKMKFGYYCNETCPSYCKGGCTQSGACNQGCIDGLWGTDCNKTCDKNCKICDESYGTCSVCKDGLAGRNCEHQCPVNCKDNRCDRNAGVCVRCKDDWYGELCNNKCSQNCATCGDNTTCIECKDGYSGKKCDQQCITGCMACTKGDNQVCNLCENSDHIYGPTCQCSTQECNITDPKTKSCLGCINAQTHYRSGKGCCRYTQKERHCKNSSMDNNGACVDGCEIGYYGKYCESRCSQNCMQTNNCNEITGACIKGCKNGWFNSKCDFNCLDNFVHCAECSENDATVTCKRCENGFSLSVDGDCVPCNTCLNSSCDSSTGKCLNGCAQGYFRNYLDLCKKCYLSCVDQDCYPYARGFVCNKCPAKYYGSQCTLECSTNCYNNTCDKKYGFCTDGCKDGYTGFDCRYSCDRCEEGTCNSRAKTCSKCKPEYYGNACQNECDKCVDGKCTSTGTCQNGCIPGRHGDKCEHKCYNTNCFACDQHTGHCEVCDDKFNGSSCSTPCPTCKNPFTNNTLPHEKECPPGKHGPNCEETCNRNCGLRTSTDSLGRCNRFTGDCLDDCLVRYYGDKCTKICGKCNFTSNVSCDTNTGYCPGECMTGFYSDKCTDNCPKGCKDLSCGREHGLCENGCNGTFSGPKCDKIVSPTPSEESSGLSGGAIGGIVVAVVVVVIVIVSAYVYSRRLKKNSSW